MSFLSLVNNDTLLFVLLEGVFNIMLVAFVVIGFLHGGYVGVGAGIAVTHTLDFVIVCTVARMRYGMRLSADAMRCFAMQLPLFVAVVAVALSGGHGWCYWVSGGVCVLVSATVTLYMFSRMSVLPASLARMVNRIFRIFRK